MFDNTKPHSDIVNNKHTIKVGTNVPTNCVNLGYFNNNKNSNTPMSVISNAPSDTIDHIFVSKDIKKYCVPKDDNIFQKNILYNDYDNYTGTLPLVDIKWYEHKHTYNEDFQTTKIYEIDSKDFNPPSLFHEVVNKDGVKLSGYLNAVDVNYINIEVKEEKNTYIKNMKNVNKTVRVNLLDKPEYNFSDTIDYDDGEYIGTLHKIQGSERYRPLYNDAKVEWKHTTVVNGGDTCVYDGEVLNRIKTESVTERVKSYGWCRYWGSTSNGNYYDSSGIKFTDTYPRVPSESSYFLPNQIKSPQKPAIINSYTPDVETARKFGGNGSTNWVWATNITQRNLDMEMGRTMAELANIAGCSQIQPDIIFGKSINYDTISIVDGGYTIGPSNEVGMKTLYSHIYRERGAASTRIEDGLARYVLERGSINDVCNVYFKDCIGFYTLNVNFSKGYYGKLIVDEGNCSYNAECDYEGIVYKKISNTIKQPTKLKAIVKYVGQLTGGYIDYNAIATYEGVVSKKNLLSMLNNDTDNVIKAYSLSDGTLVKNINDPNDYCINSEMFYITDMSKDKQPLFYCCTLKNKFYCLDDIDSIGVYTGNEIRLVNKNGNNINSSFKYKIKLIKTNIDNLYSVKIYTNFIPNINTNVYCLYNAYVDDEIIPNTLEKIYVYPCMDKYKDYTVENISNIERKNKIKVNKPLIFNDNRKKIQVEYRIKAFKDNNVIKVSEPYVVTCINKNYALRNELYNFDDDNNIISYYNETELSAKSLLNMTNKDLSNKEILCDNSNITYAGSWNKTNTAYYTSNIVGDKIIFTFEGTGIELYFIKNTHSGSVEIILDNDITKTYNVSLFSEKPMYEKCFDLNGLENKKHSVSITVTDYIDIKSLDYNVSFCKAYSYTPFDFSDSEIIYKAELTNSNLNIPICNFVNLYTNPNGNSNVSIEVFIETGILNNTVYDGKILLDTEYKEHNNKIYCQYYIKLIDNRSMVLSNSRESELLKDWYLLIQYANINKVFNYRGIKTKYVYNLPEYNTQKYDTTLNRPFVNVINEEAIYINEKLIKVKLTPIYVDLDDTNNISNVKVYIKNDNTTKEVQVENVVFTEGLIMLKDCVSENDNIVVNYTYIENYYVYRGSFINNEFKQLDINTNKYHNYDTYENNSIITNSCNNLLNSIVYIYTKPSMIIKDYSGTNLTVKAKQKSSFVTSNTNVFPETIHVSEGGYEGDISKNSSSFIVSGEQGKTLEKYYTKEITYNNTNDIKQSIYVNVDQYTGTIPKVKDPDIVNTTTVDKKNITKNNKFLIDKLSNNNTYNYSDKDGYTGILTLESYKKELLEHKKETIVNREVKNTNTITEYYVSLDGKTAVPVSTVNYSVQHTGYTGIYNKDVISTFKQEEIVNTIAYYKGGTENTFRKYLSYENSKWSVSTNTYRDSLNNELYSLNGSTIDSCIDFNMYGNYIDIEYLTGPNKGIMKIIVSESEYLLTPIEYIVDTYSATASNNTKKFTIWRKDQEVYYIKIIVYGKNSSSSGNEISLCKIHSVNKPTVSLDEYNNNNIKLHDYLNKSTDVTIEPLIGMSLNYWKCANVSVGGVNKTFVVNKLPYYSFIKTPVCGNNIKVTGYKSSSYNGRIEILLYTCDTRIGVYSTIVNTSSLPDGDITLLDYYNEVPNKYYLVLRVLSDYVAISDIIVKGDYTTNKNSNKKYFKFTDSNVEMIPDNSWNKCVNTIQSPRADEYYIENKGNNGKIRFSFTGNYLELKSHPGNNCYLEIKVFKGDYIVYEEILKDTNKLVIFSKYFKYGTYTVELKAVNNNISDKIRLTDYIAGVYNLLYVKGNKFVNYNYPTKILEDTYLYNNDLILLNGTWNYDSNSQCMKSSVGNNYIELNVYAEKFNLYFKASNVSTKINIYINNKFIESFDTSQNINGKYSVFSYTNKDINNTMNVLCVIESGVIEFYKVELIDYIDICSNYNCNKIGIINKINDKDTILNTVYSLETNGYKYKGKEVSSSLKKNLPNTFMKNSVYEVSTKYIQAIFEKETETYTDIYSDYYIGTYKGEVSKTIYNTKYVQKYGGFIKKVTKDSYLWKQMYDGMIYKKTDKDKNITLMFIVDYNINIVKYIKQLPSKIEKIYDSLKSSGVETINIGLMLYNNTKLIEFTFDGSKFTTNVKLLYEKMNDVDFNIPNSTQYTTTNTFKQIKYCINNYTFPTNKKIFIVMSDNKQSETDYTDIDNLILTNNIYCCFVTDINDSNNRIFNEVANNVEGLIVDIQNYENELISNIAISCSMNEIKIINKETIYHKVNNEIPDNNEDMLIGSVYIKHYTTLKSTILKDTRTTGGGLKDYLDSMLDELNIDSNSYYDIGYYDGEPYQQNGVIVIRLDRNILKHYGGNLTKKDVEAAVNKWCALGVVPIIEYVIPIENDRASVIDSDVDKIDVIPVINGNIVEK